MRKMIFFSFALVLLLVVTCKEAYEPEVLSSKSSFLVVEGGLNPGGTTLIKLSRTHSLSGNDQIPELKASVFIEDRNNKRYALSERANGEYAGDIVLSSECRLGIATKDGKEYYSEYIPVLKTPAIDSISWARVNNGVQIYANTHDENNKTRNYRWEFEETWMIIPKYISALETENLYDASGVYKGFRIIQRNPSNRLPFACWQSENSSSIILGSSSKLSQDIIHLAPIAYVPYPSWKLDTKYSILVKQYALTSAGFEYWQNIKKNTEGLGSIFDPQPSEIKGNITCKSDPNELVVGFFDASAVQEKRIFITNQQVADWYSDSGCQSKSVANHPDSLALIFPGYIPLDYEDGDKRVVGAPPYCVDCRLKGTDVKPSFWE